MRTALRPARPGDFDFCARLYFSGIAETIRLLKLDMVAQTTNLRQRWSVSEVQIITRDGLDIGWMQSSIRDGELIWSRSSSMLTTSVAASEQRSSEA